MDSSYQFATVLLDGRVLFAKEIPWSNSAQDRMAALYDPATRTFVATGSMLADGLWDSVTRLADGRVLFLRPAAPAEIYDPATGEFSLAGSSGPEHQAAAAVLLLDGKVLIAGGEIPNGTTTLTALRSARLYDPVTRTYTETGSMSGARIRPNLTLLKDGRVLVAGGYISDTDLAPLATAEIYDPATGTFASTGPMTEPRELSTATLLGDGRVLLTGGVTTGWRETNTAELYDPSTGKFTATGSMAAYRLDQAATLLEDGRVLITGGIVSDGGTCALTGSRVLAGVLPTTGGSAPADGLDMDVRRVQHATPAGPGATCGSWDATAEIYSPTTGRFSAAGSMTVPRGGHTAVLLADGTVLIAGGENFNVPTVVPTAEIYTP
jgi:hypothetical protein